MLDPRSWTPLRYHADQAKLWRTKHRLVAVAAGRGSGKTTLARRRIVRMLAVRKPWRNPMYFYALPTYQRARRVAWKEICNLVPKEWLAQPINNNMIIRTIFGSELHVIGLDRPQVIEGDQWDGGVVDEASDQRPEWWLSARPALSHRKGWIWLIGVPKREGWGAAQFKEFYHSSDWESYTWTSETVLPPEEIELAKRSMALKDYREQYLAAWETAGGSAFYAFDQVLNVRRCPYDPTRPIIVGSDFNVNPMAWVLCHKYDNRVEVFDEIWINNTNTRATLDVLWQRYQHHKGGFWFYGDASSRARKTSADSSDYMQILNDKRFNGVVRYPRDNPAVSHRLASCNQLLCNTSGERRLHIDRTCVNLIKDLDGRTLNDNGLPADKGEVGHITDALGYVVHALFPMRVHSSDSGRAVITAVSNV